MMKDKIPSHFGWVIVGFSFVTLALVYGVWYSFSVFFVALLKEFGWSRSIGAGAFSLFIIISGIDRSFCGKHGLDGQTERGYSMRIIDFGGRTCPLQLHPHLVAILSLFQPHHSSRFGGVRVGAPYHPHPTMVQREEGISHRDRFLWNRDRNFDLCSFCPISHYPVRMADGLSNHGCFYSPHCHFHGDSFFEKDLHTPPLFKSK